MCARARLQELDRAAIDGNAFEPEIQSDATSGATTTLLQAMAAAIHEMGIGGGARLEDLLTETDD